MVSPAGTRAVFETVARLMATAAPMVTVAAAPVTAEPLAAAVALVLAVVVRVKAPPAEMVRPVPTRVADDEVVARLTAMAAATSTPPEELPVVEALGAVFPLPEPPLAASVVVASEPAPATWESTPVPEPPPVEVEGAPAAEAVAVALVVALPRAD